MSTNLPEPNELSLGFIEGLYADFLREPASVPADWRKYFETLSPAIDPFRSRPALGPSFRPSSVFNPSGGRPGDGAAVAGSTASNAAVQEKVDHLVRAYRVRGHLAAQLDPLGMPHPEPPELDPGFHGLGDADLDRPFSIQNILGSELLTLRQIIKRMRNTYCRYIGAHFMFIDDLHVRRWLQERMESTQNRIALARDQQLRILTRLTDAVIFEEFIQKKYLGAKSFSLEGCESLIPLLELAIEKAGEEGQDEVVLAMAHRGRLNVLANIMGKSPRDIFKEFEDADAEYLLHHGDVKYHLGYGSEWETAGGRTVHLSLCFNPSHLEFVNPVALGRMRAKQDRVGDTDRVRGMVLLIHGDAAFAGEGISQETMNLSQLAGYSTGGTIHVIVNNQLGFTTPPHEGRSSTYAASVGKMLQLPIFHVNGEDPEAVAQVVQLSMDFRRTYKRDVIIDMYGYRRRGHNEGDEPSFTQPVLYRAIEKRPSIRESYLEHLLTLGGINRDQADEIAVRRRENLEQELSVARQEEIYCPSGVRSGIWAPYRGGLDACAPEAPTSVPAEHLSRLLEAAARLPEDFRPNPKIKRWLELRREMARGEKPLDWAAAEALAFATLATEGVRIRFTGQDSPRGTFSQRHAVLHDYQDGHAYAPLNHLTPGQAPVEIHNSPLSETAVLGFEFGYSLDYPDALVLWEAQFGDFVNVAQVMLDQFIAGAECKWRRLSGLVLLLPHAFEGMGPEHSSAHLERFLTLAAEDNIQVVNLTTPAQYFHCLRRQALRSWRKPLVVMAPKSLLRHPRVVSSLSELAQGEFKRIIPDEVVDPQRAKRVLLCCGKIYYELLKEREDRGRDDVAIIRLEQLYPLRLDTLQSVLSVYRSGTAVAWVQEEPENMGAWRYLRNQFCDTIFGQYPFRGITRAASASPATGSASQHRLEQRQLLAQAFGEISGN